MKISVAGAVLSALTLALFAAAADLDFEYEKIAIIGVLVISCFLLWIVLLLIELNTHFEKEEQKDDLEE